MDYALFIAGLGHFFLAVISGKLSFSKVRNIDWRYLTFFGLFSALYYWLQLASFFFTNSSVLFNLWHLCLLFSAFSIFIFVTMNLKKYGINLYFKLILVLMVVISIILFIFKPILFFYINPPFFGFLTTASVIFLLIRIQLMIKKYSLFYYTIALLIIFYGFTFLFTGKITSPELILRKGNDILFISVNYMRGIIIYLIAFGVWIFMSRMQTRSFVFHRILLRLSPQLTSFFLIILILTTGWIGTKIYGKQAKKEIYRHTLNIAEIHKTQIIDEFELAERSVAGIAGSHWINKSLENPVALNIANANNVLDRYKKSLNASVCYVMDTTGLTILSSNRAAKNSFIGKNYGFRPYFKQALAGKHGQYLAKGVTSGKKGLYASYAIRNDNEKIVGVLVMKREVTSRLLLRGDDKTIVFMLSPDGIIFLASKEGYEKYCYIPLSAEVEERILTGKQFGLKSFKPLFSAEILEKNHYFLAGKEYMSVLLPLSDDGWRIAVLGDMRDYMFYRMFAIILTFFIVFFSLIFAFFLEQIRFIAQTTAQSEMQLRTVFESVPGAIIIIEPSSFKLQDVNDYFCRMLGITKEDILKTKFENYFHSGYGAFKEDVLKVSENEIVSLKNYRLLTKEKGHVDVEGTCTAIRFKNDIGVIVFLTDVTERKKTLKAIRESERKFKSIFDNASDGIILLYNGKIFNANAKAAEIFGVEPDNFIGSTQEDFLPEYQTDGSKSHDLLMDHLATALKGKHRKFTCQYIRKDRAVFDAGVSLSRVEVNGKLMIQTIIRDISEQKKLERNLQIARDKALEAAKIKSEFLANMSHEIRTPMNGVIGMLDLVSDTVLNAEQQDYIDTAKDSAESLLTVINDILDFSKIEAGKLSIEETDINIRRIVDGIGDTLAKSAHEKGLEFICSIDSNIPHVIKGDSVRLRQVLINLANNAIKFTPQGEVLVSAKLLSSEKNKSMINFSVKDTGIGIPADKQASIFEAFQQADGSTTRKFGGTGLGLAISRQLIELMGGRLALQSEPGKGSAFSFTLVMDSLIMEDKTNETSLKLQADKNKALIIDDNLTNLRILEKMVSNFGMYVKTATSGQQGLDILKNDTKYDLLILDVRMPEMDGYTVVKKIRDEKTLTHLKIIALSSSGGSAEKKWFLKHGCSQFLNKPIKQKQLFKVIMETLDGKTKEDKPKEETKRKSTTAKTAVNKLNILLAEDNFINQKVAVRMLENAGYTVSVAQNGKEAVEMFNENNYDLILMDAQMPVMDGIEATQNIRQTKGGKNDITIIAMTAHALKGDRERFLSAGMDDYISKPVQQKELIALLEKYAGQNLARDTGKKEEQKKERPAEEQA